jgi:hypothetical protein
MTMTLGFDSMGYFEALFDETIALEIVSALAKHAPEKPLRVARSGRGGYSVFDVAKGKLSPSADPKIAKAIDKASYVDWGNSDAPLGVSPVLLPGSGWKLAALKKEKVLVTDPVAFHWDASEANEARAYLGSRCDSLLDLAEKHNLLLVYR